MPRRRKKSTQLRKPCLVFTESPVNIQTRVPTPVLCARHPPTARTVPVHELEDVPWVSPQFRGAPSSTVRHGRQRIMRQRRHSLGSVLGTAPNINKENTHCGSTAVAGHRKAKYKSLKFVGDQTTVVSLTEEVEISWDTETTGDERNENQNRISDLETSCDDAVDTRRSMTNIKLGKRGHQLILSEIPNPNVEISSKDTDIVRARSEDRGTTELDHNSSDSDAQRNVLDHSGGARKNSVQYENTKRKKPRLKKKNKLKNLRKSIFSLSALSPDSDTSVSGSELSCRQEDNVEETQRRQNSSLRSPVKRLFTSQLGAHSPRNTKFDTAYDSDSDGFHADTSVTNIEVLEDADQRTPVRRSKRIAANLRRLAVEGTPVGKTLKMMKVLVMDTPECDKGLTIRQKQLKGIL